LGSLILIHFRAADGYKKDKFLKIKYFPHLFIESKIIVIKNALYIKMSQFVMVIKFIAVAFGTWIQGR
jgi:hypothetical protein